MTTDDIPFAKLLGIEAELVEPGHAVLSLQIRDDLKRNGGIAHGGYSTLLFSGCSAPRRLVRAIGALRSP